MENKNKEMMQCVIIEFDDGSFGTFVGKACVEEDVERTIKDIKFTKPEPLPEDMFFTTRESLKKNEKLKEKGWVIGSAFDFLEQ